ncbi:MAG: hypothetical protein M3443_09120 [Actinomycetota bacterium]|nr:hypothetical protein [Actinomycetota bacterium]
MATTPSPRTALLATEALLLWPRHLASADADLWPVFAVVVDDTQLGRTAEGRALLAHLSGGPPLTLLDGICRWSVLSEHEPVLGLAVRSRSPLTLAADIVLPAQSLVLELAKLAAGPTVGITTRSLAGTLTGGVDVGEALRRMALTRSSPAPELAQLGDARLVS